MNNMQDTSNKSRTVAFLLSFFIGTFGSHRFYAKKSKTAVVMLILSITGIGAIITGPWALIDCIMILAGSFKDSEGKVIKNW